MKTNTQITRAEKLKKVSAASKGSSTTTRFVVKVGSAGSVESNSSAQPRRTRYRASKRLRNPVPTTNRGEKATPQAVDTGCTNEDIKVTARRVRAKKELADVGVLRLVDQSLLAQTRQEDIAGMLGTSQSTISRMTQRIRQQPSELQPTPREIINQRNAGQINDTEMMRQLENFNYEPLRYEPTPGDGVLRGDWRGIEDALVNDLITEEEYEQLARRISAKKAPLIAS